MVSLTNASEYFKELTTILHNLFQKVEECFPTHLWRQNYLITQNQTKNSIKKKKKRQTIIRYEYRCKLSLTKH